MKNIKPPNEVEIFGKKHGFTNVYYFDRWGKFDVYVAEKDSERECIGYPTFIVSMESAIRFASTTETLNILEIKPISDKNYTGEDL